MNKLRQVVLEIIGQLFNKTVSITKDAFLIAEGITQKVDGVVTKVRTEYLTGTTVAGTTTNIPHGLTDATYILDIDGDIEHSTGYWGVKEYNRVPVISNGFTVKYDDTNVILDNVGTNFQGQPYKVKITYIVD